MKYSKHLLIAGLVCVTALAGISLSPGTKISRSEVETTAPPADPRAWPLPELATQPEGVPLLEYKLPDLTPVTEDMPRQVQEETEYQNLAKMMNTHPDKELFRTWVDLVVQKKALHPALIYGNDGFAASFNTRMVPRGNGGWNVLPMINLNARYARSAVDQDVIEFWLAVHHEMKHYRQYYDALSNGRTEETVSFNPDLRWVDDRTEINCRYVWRHEVDAYRESCKLRYQIQADPVDEFCHWFASPEFEQAFFLEVIDERANGFSRIAAPPRCDWIFAEEAGHPNPGAYL